MSYDNGRWLNANLKYLIIFVNRISDYVMLGRAVLVIFEIIPLNAKFTIRNHPHKYICPTCLQTPLCVPSGFFCMSFFTLFSLQVINGITGCTGESATTPPKI